MKRFIYAFLLPIFTLGGCAHLPFEKEVNPGHFRLENYSYDHMNDSIEYIYTLCHQHKPTSWIAARQYPAGTHNIWVKATFQEVGIWHSYREAFVNFEMTFPEGGNYQWVSKIDQGNISIWLQDVDTHEASSEIITTPLKRHNIGDNGKIIQQCKEGSV